MHGAALRVERARGTTTGSRTGMRGVVIRGGNEDAWSVVSARFNGVGWS